MHLFILGATPATWASGLLAQGLARGHAITACVRNRAKLGQQLAPRCPRA